MNTNIKLRCIDQVLTFDSTPVIASGGQEENVLQVDFCSKWDGLTKTAVFWRNENEAYHVLLNTQNQCVIPWEVLTDEGVFYFGVVGVSTGGLQRTTEAVRYTVSKGAITSGTKPSDPTPDIYTQLLAQYAVVEAGARASAEAAKAAQTAAEQAAKNAQSAKTAAEQTAAQSVPQTRTVNGKALGEDISLTASDVGALSTKGGTVTGSVTLANGGLGFEVGGVKQGMVTGAGGGLTITLFKDGRIDRRIYLSNSTMGLASVLQLIDETGKSYDVLHTGNLALTAHNHVNEEIAPAGIKLNRGGGTDHGGYIDFHWDGTTTPTTGTSRIIEAESGTVTLNGKKIMTDGHIIAIKGETLAFSSGKATYSHPDIKSSSIVLAQLRVGSAGGAPVILGVTPYDGHVEVFSSSDSETVGRHVNLIIINP